MCSLSSHQGYIFALSMYVRSASIQINNLRDANRRFATGSLTYAAATAAAGNFHRAHLHMMRVAYLRSLGRVNSLEDKSDAPRAERCCFFPLCLPLEIFSPLGLTLNGHSLTHSFRCYANMDT
jgi:hypothetical protein